MVSKFTLNAGYYNRGAASRAHGEFVLVELAVEIERQSPPLRGGVAAPRPSAVQTGWSTLQGDWGLDFNCQLDQNKFVVITTSPLLPFHKVESSLQRRFL
jgi:hypothetical protein